MNKVNAVVVGSDGRFLRSAFLPQRGKASCKWVSEYPDATEYTLAEADGVAVRLKDAGIPVVVVTDYGKATEHEYAV